MSRQEITTYRVDIVLSTEDGESPTKEEVREMLHYQLEGDLNPYIGLKCIGVYTVPDRF